MNKVKEFFEKAGKWLFLFLTPAILLILMQFIELGEISTIGDWLTQGFQSFLFSYIVVLLASLFVSVIFNSTFVGSLVVGLFGLILAGVSSIKLLEAGEVLSILDFNFLREVGEIAELLKPSTFFDTSILINILLIIAIAISLVLLKKYKLKFNIWVRIAIFVCVPLILSSMFFKTGRQLILKNIANDITTGTHSNEMHKNKGIVAALYLEHAVQKENESTIEDLYNKERIFSILDSVKETKSAKLETKPNVIVVMSEAFMDLTQVSGLEFSADPIPTIHSLMDNYISGTSITSCYGKNTANMEFELFTGNTVDFFPESYVVYRDEEELFETDMYTMQKEFKKEGYSTIAIHTYDGTFYNRDTVYPKLGFDKFYGAEDFPDAPLGSKYISDEFLIDQVIKNYEETEGPKFIFALSMQNHYPYSTEYYSEPSPVTVTCDEVSDANMDKVQAYVQGQCDVDASMKKLVDFLETQDEPTIVLFYGDHLPLLTVTFTTLGYMDDVEAALTGEELYNARKIPFFIYNNFGHEQEFKENENTTWTKLGSFLLSYAGIDKPIYYDFIDNLSFKTMYHRIFIDEKDNVYSEPTYKYSKEIEDYKLLQHDILYGEQYIKEWEAQQK